MGFTNYLQESLISENVPDPMDAEQTWPTEEEMEECTVKKVKKIPKGMSEYQAAWIPDEDAGKSYNCTIKSSRFMIKLLSSMSRFYVTNIFVVSMRFCCS